MTYDGLILAATAAELNRLLPGARVQKVRQHNETDVTIELRSPGRTHLLFLSVDARFPRVYLTAAALPSPQQPPNFCMVMRKHAEGAFITRVQQIGMDRILHIHLEHGDHTKLTLVLEIMGKHSNLILLDGQDRILGAAKHIGSSASRYRQVLPGREYIPPPGTNKLDLRTLDPATLHELWATKPDEWSPHEWLMNTFGGFGPFLADEMISRATRNDELSPEGLLEELAQLADTVRSESYLPVFITGSRGESKMVYPMPSVQFPPDQQHQRPSINEALDALFRSLVTRTRLEDQRTQLLTAIRRATASRKQTLKSIERTISEADRADSYRQTGELIMANLHAIEKGSRTAALTNFYETDMPTVEVELDEKLTPVQNAERYFKRYQKARDAVATANERRAQTVASIDTLQSAFRDAESASDLDLLRELRKNLQERGLLRQEISPEKQAEEFGGFRIRRTALDGWEVLYGENSQANDYLTQRVARPNDIWLHARSITGAHVVIRTAGHSGEVPKPILLQAARIAAQNSEAKHSSLVPVDYTHRKHVRKPRGSAPGFVTYRNEKTIDVSMKP